MAAVSPVFNRERSKEKQSFLKTVAIMYILPFLLIRCSGINSSSKYDS